MCMTCFNYFSFPSPALPPLFFGLFSFCKRGNILNDKNVKSYVYNLIRPRVFEGESKLYTVLLNGVKSLTLPQEEAASVSSRAAIGLPIISPHNDLLKCPSSALFMDPGEFSLQFMFMWCQDSALQIKYSVFVLAVF